MSFIYSDPPSKIRGSPYTEQATTLEFLERSVPFKAICYLDINALACAI